jgi:hypothetical protein
MSLLPQLERDLLAAANRGVPSRLAVRRSIALALVLIAVLAVPALAVTGAFSHHRRDIVSTLGGCSGHAQSQAPPPSTQPPQPALLRLLGALRRPRTPADTLPNWRAAGFMRPNPEATRLVRRDPDGTRYYLGPVDNLGYEPPIPDKPGCRVLRFQRQRRSHKVEPGVCMFVFGPHLTGGSCGTATTISRGLTTQTGGGRDRAGVLQGELTGIAPDDVRSVLLRFPRRRSLSVPVIGNVYAAYFSGSAGRAVFYGRVRVLFRYSDGRLRQVEPTEPSRAQRRRMRRQQRLVAERDSKATRVPSVFPPSGLPRTVFTLRVRLPLPKRPRETYVITLRGPEPGRCRRELVFLTAAMPQSGPQRRPGRIRQRFGLLNYGLGAYNVGPGREWCHGVYRGSIAYAPNGPKQRPRTIAGRFSFRVR